MVVAGDQAAFEALLTAMMSASNEQRTQAEAVFGELKKHPDACVSQLIRSLRNSPDLQCRSLCAVMLRKVRGAVRGCCGGLWACWEQEAGSGALLARSAGGGRVLARPGGRLLQHAESAPYANNFEPFLLRRCSLATTLPSGPLSLTTPRSGVGRVFVFGQPMCALARQGSRHSCYCFSLSGSGGQKATRI